MMNIYLDIDGVLITKDGQPAQGVVEFLKSITDNHDVHWLTTHCQGDGQTAIDYLSDKLPTETLLYIKKIKPTSWQTLKTKAIDFNQEFRWFDDYIMEAEQNILEKNAASNFFIQIDLKKEPNMLKKIINNL